MMSAQPRPRRSTSQPSIPIPDPTDRTIEQLQREISGVKEQILSTVDGTREVISTRLNGMDRAIALVHEHATQLPVRIIDAVSQLQKIQDERFRSIETQFTEKDKRLEQTSTDSKVAIAAALQAQKEAVGQQNESNSLAIAKSEAAIATALQAQKEAVSQQNESNSLAIAKSEAAFTKQIDQIATLIGVGQKNADDKFDDIKSRLQAIEGRSTGAHDVWGYVFGAIGLLIGLATVATTLLRPAIH
jgi:hypothetical protein